MLDQLTENVTTLAGSGVFIALVMGLTAAFRQVVASKFMPLVSFAIGSITGAALGYSLSLPFEGVLAGMLVGLSASGLYDWKHLFKKKK